MGRPWYTIDRSPFCELCLLLFGNNIWKKQAEPKSEIAGIGVFLVSMVSMYLLSYPQFMKKINGGAVVNKTVVVPLRDSQSFPGQLAPGS